MSWIPSSALAVNRTRRGGASAGGGSGSLSAIGCSGETVVELLANRTAQSTPVARRPSNGMRHWRWLTRFIYQRRG